MNLPTSPPRPHPWRFFRCGGFDQVVLDTADDLRNLPQLDPKLWTALNCPTHGLEFDAKTLALLDTDGDQQLRVPEIVAAVQWSCSLLRDPAVLFAGGPLALASIDSSQAEGATLLATAQQVLRLLGKPDATHLAPEDLADPTRLFAPDHPNGDGIVPAALAGADLAEVVAGILATQAAATDRSGEPGINADSLAAFFDQAQAVQAWRAQPDPSTIQPLGEATAAAVAAIDAVAAKVEDYYTRCRLAAFDPRAGSLLNPPATTYEALAVDALSTTLPAVEALPLAHVAPDAALPLAQGVNPAWVDRVAALQGDAIVPLLGARDALSLGDWQDLKARVAPYRAWRALQPQTPVADLPSSRLQAWLDGDARQRLQDLLDADSRGDASAVNIDALQRLVHYHRDLVTLLRNVVTMSDFYRRDRKAIFQAGTLYLDQRSCELVLRVSDMNAHARMAPFSGCYLVYCSCERTGEAPLTIVAALTGGAVDELMVPGRHGVFYDREGRDWKATVLKVVEQPVSIRQAFFSPYRRLAAFVENQIRGFASARDKDVQDRSQARTLAAGQAVAAPSTENAAAAPASGFDIARFAGIFAAIGLAIGAIGTALTAALGGLVQLAWWQWPLVLAGIALAISGPSMLLAWLTLRRRNLGPLLDANGWAINARARINLPFGAALTGLATLPSGSSRSLADPYAEKRSWWPFGLLAASLVLVYALWRWGG